MPSNHPITVLWLIKGLGPGGAEQLLLNHAVRSDGGGFRYEAAYVVAEKQHLVKDLEAMGVACSRLDDRPPGRWVVQLRRQLLSDPVDVLHIHSPVLAAGCRLMVRTLPRRCRPAVLYTEHNRWPGYRLATRWANRLTYPLDDDHIAVSEDVRRTVGARLRSSVDVLVHGIDLDAVQALRAERGAVRRELGIGDDEVVVGTVANLRAQKGYDTLLQAARRVVDQAPSTRFVAVGQGPLANQVEAWHQEQELGDRFLLLGYRPDAVRVMSGFDIFTLTSTHEGLPVALMEALALGLPVVATAVGGVPEAVTDGREAVLVPSGRDDLLAGAYLGLVGDDRRRRTMGEAAARRAEHFSSARAAGELEDRYRRLVQRPRT